MKAKLLLSAFFFISLFTSFAQNNFPKGSVLLGGSVSYSSGKTEDSSPNTAKSSSFNISPAVGIAVKENLFVGVSLGFMYGKNRYVGPGPINFDSSKYNGFSYGVFARKYKPVKYGFSVFLQGDLSASNTKYTSSGYPFPNENVQKNFGIGLSVTPGISYSLTSRMQLETGLNSIVGVYYNQSKSTNTNIPANFTKSTSFNASANLNNFSSQLFFGFRFLLQKQVKSST